ncbi:hypothetical protein D9Q98_003478 [Chlorella vulgaris]|uniref:Transmembrane protein 42 n=1 Tax=Chlorella vulgaris TaxID=3077 RepID=A0A9D4YYZ9_CHLVU|nr:hypothetical protein D9Q98_003478 [Chlorella vulgaris]
MALAAHSSFCIVMSEWSEFLLSLYGFALCSLGGLSGAIAAVFGKIAGLDHLDQTATVLCYVLLVVCNALMMVLYTRALRYNSSLASTAATTAVNITATGLLGKLVFGEMTSLQWWVGASSIFVGSILIGRAQRKQAQLSEEPADAADVPGAEHRAQQEQGVDVGSAAKGGTQRRRRRA